MGGGLGRPTRARALVRPQQRLRLRLRLRALRPEARGAEARGRSGLQSKWWIGLLLPLQALPVALRLLLGPPPAALLLSLPVLARPLLVPLPPGGGALVYAARRQRQWR